MSSGNDASLPSRWNFYGYHGGGDGVLLWFMDAPRIVTGIWLNQMCEVIGFRWTAPDVSTLRSMMKLILGVLIMFATCACIAEEGQANVESLAGTDIEQPMTLQTQDHRQKQIVDWASKSIAWKDNFDGSRSISFSTPYFFGDIVRFDSVNGKGTGFIDGIDLGQDGSVCYTVQDRETKYEDGQYVIHGGIYPDEITLIQRGIELSEPEGAESSSQSVHSETNEPSASTDSRR